MRLTLALALLASPAFADTPNVPPCAPHDTMAEVLGQRYGEGRVAVALGTAPSGSGTVLLEWWANPETGTWSMTMMVPDGPACMVAYGTAWEAHDDYPVGEPA